MSTSTTRMTVADFRASQTVMPQWMRDAVADRRDSDMVNVTRRSTFAGTFVMAVAPADR